MSKPLTAYKISPPLSKEWTTDMAADITLEKATKYFLAFCPKGTTVEKIA